MTIGMRAIGCLAAAALLATTGCGGDSDDTQVQDQKVEINVFWWGGEKRADMTEKALAL